MAGAMPFWCTLELLWLCFDYPFNQLQVERVLAPVASTNVHAYDLCKRAGYRIFSRVPKVVPRGDLVVFSMEREHCKWLRYGKRFQPSSRANGELAA
jgi:hypothetical protein